MLRYRGDEIEGESTDEKRSLDYVWNEGCFLLRVGSFRFPSHSEPWQEVSVKKRESSGGLDDESVRGRHCHAVRRNRCGSFDRIENGERRRKNKTWDGSARDLLDWEEIRSRETRSICQGKRPGN
jgi:hypothetical protein